MSSNIWIEGVDGITVTGTRTPFGLNLNPTLDFLPATRPNTGLVTESVLTIGQSADELRGGQALAGAYESYILDSFQPEAELAAETALRGGANADDVARQLATYDIEGIKLGASRALDAVERAGARIAAAAAARLPEVAITATRVGTSTPLGVASLIVEGAVYLGSWLSDLAYRNAVERFVNPQAPPPRRPPPPAATVEPEPEDFVIPGVTVTAPRPVSSPVTANPLFFQPSPTFNPLPSPLGAPTSQPQPAPRPTAQPVPIPPPLVFDFPLTDPLQFSSPRPAPPDPGDFLLADPLQFSDPVLTATNPGGVGSPNVPRPSSTDPCNCRPQQQKKKRKKKQPREVCYSGTYIERSRSLSKSRKRKVPCR